MSEAPATGARPAPEADTDTQPLEIWDLRLYVTGRSATCQRAADNLQRVCEQYLPGRYRIEVVDLLENPRLAAEDQILAVPTVVRMLPAPVRTLVGDLSDTERLLVGLQLRTTGSGT